MIRLAITTSSGRSTFVSDRTEILLGSREGADLRIEDADVARNHCILRVVQGGSDQGALMLVDLGSPQGVQFAGQVIRQARLRVGSAFRLGNVLVEVEEVGGAPAPASPPIPPPPPVAPPIAPTGQPVAAGTMPAPPQGPSGSPIAAPHTADFGREVRRVLSQAPWYLISAIVHALVLLILWTIPVDVGVEEDMPGLEAVMREADSELDDAEDEEPDIESLIAEEPDEEFAEDDVDPEVDKTEESAPMEMVEPEIDPVGLMRNPNYRIKAKKIIGKSLDDGEVKVDRQNIQGAQEKARAIVAKGHGNALRRLRGQPASRIVVVGGEFDEMQRVLDLYKIPYVLIERRQLVSYNLRGAKILCLNCGRSPTPLQKNVLVNKVRKFAKSGGWIISSDWALAPYLTEAFPSHIREFTPKKRQTDTTITVSATKANSPLLRDVFARTRSGEATTRWWLEEASKFFSTKGSRTEILVRSEEMRKLYGSGAVVVTFRPARNSRVLHLMGHFWQKDGNHAGVVAMQRLIINFLDARFGKAPSVAAD